MVPDISVTWNPIDLIASLKNASRTAYSKNKEKNSEIRKCEKKKALGFQLAIIQTLPRYVYPTNIFIVRMN